MTFAIPANPGCYLIESNNVRQVIVGWLVHAGGTATPVTLKPVGDLTSCTILLPDSGVVPALPDSPEPATAPAPKATQTTAPKTTGPLPTVKLTGKPYAKKTFWHMDDEAGNEWVLEVDGGQNFPVGVGVTKIKRDDFFTLRKSVTVLEYQQLADGADEGDSPEESDDGDDLI